MIAALAVYVRRAYRAYTLLTINFEHGDGMDDGDAPHIVTWDFKMGQSHSPPSTPRIDERKYVGLLHSTHSLMFHNQCIQQAARLSQRFGLFAQRYSSPAFASRCNGFIL